MNPKISDHESLLNICKHYSISIYNQLECMLRNKAWFFTPLFYTTKPTNWNFAFDFFPEDNEEVIQSDTKVLYIRTGNLNIEIHSNFIYEEFFNTKLISEIDSQTMELRNKTKSKEKLQDLVYTQNLFTEIAEHDLDVENYYFTIETKNKRVEIPRIGTKQKLINEQNQRIHSSQPIIPIEIVPEIPISNIPEVVGKSHNLQEIEIKNENTPLKIKLNKIEIFTLVSEEFSKRRCAFRVRMPRKPANMGIKAWTVADNCNYVYTWDIFKGVSEKSKDTLLRMTKMAKLDDVEDFYHKVYADSYFGSLEAAEELVEIGVSFNLCVKNDRPSDLFKNNLHQDLRNGEWKSLLKSINGHKLLACTYRDKHKSSTKNVNIITDSINNLEIVKGEKIKPKNIEDYSQNMQYVDRADQNVSSFLFPHKTFSWKKAVLFYYFKVLIHNSKIIFEKKNQQKITLINFISPLCDQLAGKRTIIGHIEHKIIRRQPKRDCSFCRNKFNKSSSTTIKCSGCDCYLHKRCFDYIHYIFK
ncbi:piggybac transposable element-derived protein [Anaeramoeba flamelloides]|uniref:Piggybac transposable element-derived protein n=1 Tax=Anaeramoeba flamelloides TaxID=1746091 RepID=A0ABQ8XGH3_9EUKA|nr:piggybac transposable element-derived protein [Anaeramoeba flamelloides]